MKRKILSLVFAAAMLLGTATMTSGDNNWPCLNTYLSCGLGQTGHMVLVCGDTPQDMIEQYYEWQEELCDW